MSSLESASAFGSKIRHLTRSPLKMVSVHVTDFCNSKCDFCVVNSPMTQTPIATERLVRAVEAFAGVGAEVLNIHGGEATVSQALFPVLAAGRRIGVPEAHLQTNGIRLADRRLVEQLIEAGVSVFVISLHGHDAATQEAITLTPRSFDRVVTGIRNCLEAGALVRTNTVVCRQNIETLYEALALSCELGVPWQNISALHPSQHAMASFQRIVVHPQEVRAKLPLAVQRLQVNYPDTVVELEGMPRCHAPGLEALHIDTTLRRIRMAYHDQVFDDYEEYMNRTQRRLEPTCVACPEVLTCKGVYHAYVTEFDGPVVWPLDPSD